MAVAKKVEKKVTFSEILKRSNSSIKGDRAKRIAKSAGMAYEAMVSKKKREIFVIEDELETQIDLSADNRTTSMNSVKNFNAEDFINKRTALRQSLAILNEELAILEEDELFYKS